MIARTLLILENSFSVIGNHGVTVPFDLTWRAFMPLRTCSKCTIALMLVFGQWFPKCKCLIPDRYPLIVVWEEPPELSILQIDINAVLMLDVH